MAETTLTLKFRGLEASILNQMVDLGLFNTKSEAIRAALVKYAIFLDTNVFIYAYEFQESNSAGIIDILNDEKISN